MKHCFISLFLLCTLSASVAEELTLFAASSTTDALKEISNQFTKKTGTTIRFNFASSGLLARQIEAGAPADLFISANTKWMDYLENKNSILPETRFNLATNTLVLIAPTGSALTFSSNIPGRIATGDFKSVPAGMYAKESLTHLNWLDTLKPNLIMSANVRTALMYVERGEVAAGIVYSSDAKQSKKVSIIGTFPPESHSPIIYPVAACSDTPNTKQFLKFLKSLEAQAILKKNEFQ